MDGEEKIKGLCEEIEKANDESRSRFRRAFYETFGTASSIPLAYGLKDVGEILMGTAGALGGAITGLAVGAVFVYKVLKNLYKSDKAETHSIKLSKELKDYKTELENAVEKQ